MSDSDLTTLLRQHQVVSFRSGDPWKVTCACRFEADVNAHSAHVASVLSGVYAITPLPETTRWYTAAYRADNGNVIPVGVEYVKQCWADEVRDEWQCDEPDGKYFVAHRDVPAWQETPQ